MKCPFKKKNCLKDECALWVKLTTEGKVTGRCAIAWNAILLVEIREATDRKSNRARVEEE